MSSLNRRSRPSPAFILGIIALLLSALYVVGLIFDWPSWVHGSNWVWVRRVPEMGARFLLMPAALAAGLALGAWALRGDEWPRRPTALLLGGLVVLTPLLQIAVAAQHRTQPLSPIVMGAAGFWQEGVRIEDPALFIREHTANMPAYGDVHLRTQPPGWPLVYWAVSRVFNAMPGAADITGRWFHRYDCVAPELAGLDPGQLAAGGLRAVILLLSGLGALPLYAVGRRFYPPPAARLAAVGYAYMPALLVFSGRFDVAYALLAVAGLWLALRAALDGDRLAAGVLAASLAAASFLSFTALPVGAFVLAVAGACVLEKRDGAAPRRLVWTGVAVAAAVALLWGGLWAFLGADGIAMWRVSQDIHRVFRLNYPVWFTFNLYDLAVFMGIVPFVGAVAAATAGLRGGRGAPGRGLALGWAASVLLLNLSATVRAETGRLWLFLMPIGLLVGLAWFVGGREKGEGRREKGEEERGSGGAGVRISYLVSRIYLGWRGRMMALFGAFLVQALVTGYLLGGRAGMPATPAPTWRVPEGVTAVDVRLGESVALRGYEMEQAPDGLRLTLYWRALDFPRAEYSVFVHALDAEGEIVAQSDGPPAAVPIWCWVPGEVVADERLLDAPPETRGVGVGLYDPLTGVRLPVSPPTPDDRILLPLGDK